MFAQNATTTLYDDSLDPEVDRAMRVLTDPAGDEFQPSVLVKEIEPILSQAIESVEKVKQIQQLIAVAKERCSREAAQRLLRKQVQAITQINLDHEQKRKRASGRKISFAPSPTGPYISSEDAGRSPMLRSSWNARMLLLMFGGFLVIEPFFIALSTDVQTLSIVFFVVTMFFGAFTVYYFIDTREQELRMFLMPDDGSHVQESRDVSLTYASGAFFVVLFIQLIYALMSARAPVSALTVTLIVLLSCVCLFGSYGFLVSFENAYRLSD